jgi:hypothetical protein
VSVPLRNDLACSKIYLTNEVSKKDYGENREINTIIVHKSKKSAQLVLNDYKTAGTYGQKVIEFPPDIAKEVIKWYPVIIRMSPNHWFIKDHDDDDKCISRVTYTKWMNGIFADTGKKVSTTQIRRTIVSDLYDVDENEMKQKEQLADVMGHSVETANKVYAKAK